MCSKEGGCAEPKGSQVIQPCMMQSQFKNEPIFTQKLNKGLFFIQLQTVALSKVQRGTQQTLPCGLNYTRPFLHTPETGCACNSQC